jgi:hypothetical protein
LGPPTTDAGHAAFTALTHWVEDGAAAAQIVATKFVDDDPARGIAMQRPLLSLSERRKILFVRPRSPDASSQIK